MINIAIVEDEAEHSNLLKHCLSRYAEEKKESFNIRTFSNGVSFLEPYSADYDIVFMDIKMPYMDGMTCAHKLREIDKNVILIFITSMRQYAIQGYEVEAFHYLIKPLQYFDFALKLTKAIERTGKSTGTVDIIVNTETGFKKIPPSAIKFVEVKNHHCEYNTTEGIFRQYQQLKAAENALKDFGFIKCNNYCLVNLAFVTEIDGSTAVVGDARLDISRPRKRDFTDKFTEFTKRHGGR